LRSPSRWEREPSLPESRTRVARRNSPPHGEEGTGCPEALLDPSGTAHVLVLAQCGGWSRGLRCYVPSSPPGVVRNLEIELGETLSLRMMRTPGDRLNRVNSWFQLAKTPQSQPGGRDAADRGDTRGASGPPGSRLRV